MGQTIHSDAVYGLNSYLWKVLQANLGWTEANYGNRRPIIPANQEPEFLQYDKPFIVFGSAVNRFDTMPFITSETVAYTIYATTASEANNIMRVITEVFKWMDESAQNVNAWIVREGQTRVGGRRQISFKSITVLQASSAGPELTEGGRVDSQVLVGTQYVDYGEMKMKVGDFLP